ncbi:uncharacterized protein si:rp71-17i16.6 [Esox lucius]|uniref:uncharacterized protein si:rp71-17i16.6 n=1 Tax=Esox lucius TaxID=8010 RepID=UPI00147698D7|nr:uncharacterized protein si:rp71-17i16.6 [Esox lucius]
MLGTSHDPSESNTGAGPEQDHCLYLRRLLGKETADYFLNPSPTHTASPNWYTVLMEHMGGEVSAEALWEALTEHSTKQLKNQEDILSLKRDRGYLRHLTGVRLMFYLAQLKQAYSAQLLSFNHPALLQDELEQGP